MNPMRHGRDGTVGGKPVILKNGQWLLPIYVLLETTDFDEALDYYHPGLSPCALRTLKHDLGPLKGPNVYRSRDQGKSWELFGEARLPQAAIAAGHEAMEHMIIEHHDGSLWMLARTPPGIGQSFSNDGGKTWTEIQHFEAGRGSEGIGPEEIPSSYTPPLLRDPLSRQRNAGRSDQ